MFLKITERLKTIVGSLIETFSSPYWVEISTKQPSCTYYFGPFGDSSEASEMQHGYVEDLVAEKAQDIKVTIKRCLPTELTITEEELPVG